MQITPEANEYADALAKEILMWKQGKFKQIRERNEKYYIGDRIAEGNYEIIKSDYSLKKIKV